MCPSVTDPVLIDATLVRNFLRPGFHNRLPEYFGERAYMLLGVEKELERHAKTSQTLKSLLARWPSADALELPPDLQQKATDLIDFYRGDTEHKHINRGEIETYYMARQLFNEGKELLVISDDGLAKDYCRGKEDDPDNTGRIPCIDTPTLLLHMVCEGFLAEQDGQKIWEQGCFHNNQNAWKGYKLRLKSMRG